MEKKLSGVPAGGLTDCDVLGSARQVRRTPVIIYHSKGCSDVMSDYVQSTKDAFIQPGFGLVERFT